MYYMHSKRNQSDYEYVHKPRRRVYSRKPSNKHCAIESTERYYVKLQMWLRI